MATSIQQIQQLQALLNQQRPNRGFGPAGREELLTQGLLGLGGGLLQAGAPSVGRPGPGFGPAILQLQQSLQQGKRDITARGLAQRQSQRADVSQFIEAAKFGRGLENAESFSASKKKIMEGLSSEGLNLPEVAAAQSPDQLINAITAGRNRLEGAERNALDNLLRRDIAELNEAGREKRNLRTIAATNRNLTRKLDAKVKEATAKAVKLSDVSSLRGQFLKESGDFQEAQIGLEKVRAASKEDTGAGDIALTFGFMKILDPRSTVREGEAATVENTAGIPARIRNIYNKMVNGERLTPGQRKNLVRAAEGAFTPYQKSQATLEKNFRGIATRNGINPKDVIVGREAITPAKKGSKTLNLDVDGL